MYKKNIYNICIYTHSIGSYGDRNRKMKNFMKRCAKMSRLLFIANWGAKKRLKARFERENLKHISVMSQGLYGNQAVGKWAQALTTQWGCVLYCASAFVCVELSRRGQMPAGHMGLVLLYSAQLQRGMMDYMSPSEEHLILKRPVFFLQLLSFEESTYCVSPDIIRFPSDRTYPTSLFFRRLVSRHVEMSVFVKF